MDNCNKGINMGCCEPVMVFEDASNFYTKSETNDAIDTKLESYIWVDEQGIIHVNN